MDLDGKLKSILDMISKIAMEKNSVIKISEDTSS